MSMTIVLIICLFFTAMCALAGFLWVKEIREDMEEYVTERFVNIGISIAELREQLEEAPELDANTAKELADRFEKRWESAIDTIMNYDPFKGDSE